jgi:hypothetical protein
LTCRACPTSRRGRGGRHAGPCMHLASTADNACDDDEPGQRRGYASPVELVLAGRVAVGGVPAVEVLAGFVSQPLDGLDRTRSRRRGARGCSRWRVPWSSRSGGPRASGRTSPPWSRPFRVVGADAEIVPRTCVRRISPSRAAGAGCGRSGAGGRAGDPDRSAGNDCTPRAPESPSLTCEPRSGSVAGREAG